MIRERNKDNLCRINIHAILIVHIKINWSRREINLEEEIKKDGWKKKGREEGTFSLSNTILPIASIFNPSATLERISENGEF